VKASLYNTGYNELRSVGTITGAEAPKIVASLVEPASKFGGQVVSDWTKNKVGADTANTIAKSANSAQYAVELADQKITEEDKGFSQTTTTSTGTVNRTVVDNSVTTIVTEQKAPIIRTRNAQTRDPNDPRRLELEKQVNNITSVEIPAAKQRFLETNPSLTFADFLRSNEYKILVDRRTALQTQIESL
jgi:hypothetical protein